MGALKKAVQSLWTFRISGGSPFGLEISRNPCVEHNGGTSVFHLVLSPEEVRVIEDVATRRGCKVELWVPEGESAEQREERMTLLNQQNRVWPSTECPTCAWFDPLLKDGEPCGLAGWEESAVTAFKKNTKAFGDLEGCPVPHIHKVSVG
tara:strand:- start:5828 stop:6277 length:450 start_codon:yes stop_codon:yes gene_type:complete